MTLVRLLVSVAPTVSVAAMVKTVVTALPDAAGSGVGAKLSASSAAETTWVSPVTL